MLLTEKKENGQPKSKSMGRGQLSIERANINGKFLYICVFRNSLGKTLYTGKLDALHSRKRKIEEKATKNYIKVRFLSVGLNPVTKKFTAEDCVIMFAR